MPKILLLHTNTEYATSLSETINSLGIDYKIDVVSREPIRTRFSHLLSGKYDLIQTDELLVNGIFSLSASLITNTPFIVSIRGWADYTNAHREYGKFRDLSIQFRSKAVLRRASKVIYLSSHTQHEIEQRYQVDNSTVIGRPINLRYYQGGNSGKKDSSNNDTINFLTVTNLRYEGKFRGVKNTLIALDGLFERHDKLRYIIAGDGQYLNDLYEFLDDYPHSDRVNVLGFCDDIPNLLARANIFVYVSYLDAYPTVVLEAQAAGLPIIGGNAVGVPEVVGDAGLLCHPTPDGIRDAIEQVLSNDSFRKELAKKSREKMRTYNEECAKKYVEVWDYVLSYS